MFSCPCWKPQELNTSSLGVHGCWGPAHGLHARSGALVPGAKIGGFSESSTPITHQEEDFLRPSSREEAQKLWEMERLKMQEVLDKQQKQMVEDYQWLRQEEKSLVSGLGSSPALAPSQKCWKSHKNHLRCFSWPEKPLFLEGTAPPVAKPLAPLYFLHP